MSLASEFKSRALGFAITGFSVIVGMSYNETLKSFINAYLPLQTDALLAKMLYSLILTFMLVVLINYFQSLDNTLINKSNKKEIF